MAKIRSGKWQQQLGSMGYEYLAITDLSSIRMRTNWPDLEFMAFGVGVARRGWLEPRDVLNTLAASKLRQTLTRRQAA